MTDEINQKWLAWSCARWSALFRHIHADLWKENRQARTDKPESHIHTRVFIFFHKVTLSLYNYIIQSVLELLVYSVSSPLSLTLSVNVFYCCVYLNVWRKKAALSYWLSFRHTNNSLMPTTKKCVSYRLSLLALTMDIWQAKRDMNYEKWAMKSRPKKAAWQYLINTVHIIFHLYLLLNFPPLKAHSFRFHSQFSATAAEMLTFSFATIYSEFELHFSTFTGHIMERESMLDATASRGRVIGTEEKREKLSAIVEGEKLIFN